MTWGGLLVMVLSIGSVLTALTFCLYTVMTLPPVDEVRLDERGDPIAPGGDA